MDQYSTFKEIGESLTKHFADDLSFQEKVNVQFEMMNKQFERMNPMIKAFEDKKIDKMVFNRKTKTLYVYAKEWGTIFIFLGTAWAFIKYILIRILLK